MSLFIWGKGCKLTHQCRILHTIIFAYHKNYFHYLLLKFIVMYTSFVMLVFLMCQEKSLLVLAFFNTKTICIIQFCYFSISSRWSHTFHFPQCLQSLMNVNEFEVLNLLQHFSRLWWWGFLYTWWYLCLLEMIEDSTSEIHFLDFSNS